MLPSNESEIMESVRWLQVLMQKGESPSAIDAEARKLSSVLDVHLRNVYSLMTSINGLNLHLKTALDSLSTVPLEDLTITASVASYIAVLTRVRELYPHLFDKAMPTNFIEESGLPENRASKKVVRSRNKSVTPVEQPVRLFGALTLHELGEKGVSLIIDRSPKTQFGISKFALEILRALKNTETPVSFGDVARSAYPKAPGLHITPRLYYRFNEDFSDYSSSVILSRFIEELSVFYIVVNITDFHAKLGGFRPTSFTTNYVQEEFTPILLVWKQNLLPKLIKLGIIY